MNSNGSRMFMTKHTFFLAVIFSYNILVCYLFLKDCYIFQKPLNIGELSSQSDKIIKQRGTAFETYFPNRNRFVFEDIIFDSDFDGGNLLKAEKIQFNHYRVWISCDGQNTPYARSRSTGFFFFKVVVLKDLKRYKQLKITVENFSNNQRKNIQKGLVPVYRITPHQPEWKYLPYSLDQATHLRNHTRIAFSFNITKNDKEVFFASCIPYNTTDNKHLIDQLEKSAENYPDLFFRRDVLTYSLQGRPVEFLTLTLKPSRFNEHTRVEEYAQGELSDIFPNIYYNYNDANESCSIAQKWISPPPVFKNKKILLITARIHAGEAPASHIIDSFLRNIIKRFETKDVKEFLSDVIVLAVPLLNPDGVTNGFYRYDSRSNDLNRCYNKENKQIYPVNYALKKIIDYYKETDRFYMFIDLHAHSQCDGLFLFANYGDSEDDRKEVRYLYDSMDSLCENFTPQYSKFDFESPKLEDGMGRIHIKRSRNLKHIYVIESAYYKGQSLARRKFAPPENRLEGQVDNLHKEDFERMGQCILESVTQVWPKIARKSPYFD